MDIKYSLGGYLPTCSECGATVVEECFDKHTNWHNIIDEAFRDVHAGIREASRWRPPPVIT